MKIVIVVEGGLIEKIVVDTKQEIDIILVDYDTDFALDDETQIVDDEAAYVNKIPPTLDRAFIKQTFKSYDKSHSRI